MNVTFAAKYGCKRATIGCNTSRYTKISKLSNCQFPHPAFGMGRVFFVDRGRHSVLPARREATLPIGHCLRSPLFLSPTLSHTTLSPALFYPSILLSSLSTFFSLSRCQLSLIQLITLLSTPSFDLTWNIRPYCVVIITRRTSSLSTHPLVW